MSTKIFFQNKEPILRGFLTINNWVSGWMTDFLLKHVCWKKVKRKLRALYRIRSCLTYMCNHINTGFSCKLKKFHRILCFYFDGKAHPSDHVSPWFRLLTKTTTKRPQTCTVWSKCDVQKSIAENQLEPASQIVYFTIEFILCYSIIK